MLQGIRKSLTLKWMIFSILLATIPLSIAGFSIIQIYQKDLKKSVIGIEEMKASMVVERTEAFFEKITSHLFTLVNDEDFRIRHSSSHVKNLLENLVYQNDYIWELALLDKRGKEVMKVSKYRVIGPDDLESQAKSEMFGVASKGNTYYGEFFLTKDTVPTMGIAVPVNEYKGKPVGVLSVKIHLRYLWNLIPQIQIGKEGSIYVVDKEGNLIAHPDTRRVLLGLNVRYLPMVDQVVSGKEGNLEFEYPDGERVLCIYKSIKKLGWGVIVQVPVKEAYGPLEQIAHTALMWILVGLVIAILLSFFLMRKLILPIKRLSKEMGEVAKGNLDAYIQPTTKDEMGLLTKSFNQMIQDLKQSQEALKATEAKYRRIFEESKDMVYTTSVEGKIIDVNQAGVEMLGYASKKELREMNARDLYLHPDGRARFQKEVEQNGFVKDFEFKLRKRDGTPFDCLITATARKDGEDHIIGYEGFIKDISDRKRMEEELVQSKKELQTLYDLSKLVNQSLDLNEVLSISLDKAMTLAGFEMGGIYLLQEDGEAFEFKYHKGFGPRFVENVRFLKFGDGICGKAIRLKKTIGLSIDEYPAPELLPFLREEGIQSLISIPLLAKEKPIGAVNLASRFPHFITPEEINLLGSFGNQIGLALENARLFSNVAKAKTEWETTFDAVTDLITIRDKDYRIIRANVSAFKRFGLRPEEMIGKKCYELLYHREDFCGGCFVSKTLETKKPTSGERYSKYLNGIFRYYAFPIYDEEGGVVAVIDLAREITEEKRLEIEREVVGNVNKILASSLDMRQVMRAVHAELKRVLDCERMTVTLFDEEEKGFRYFALEKDYEAKELVEGVIYPQKGSHFERVAETGLPEIIMNNAETDSWIGPKLLKEGIQSTLIFPLAYKGKIIGTMNLGSRKTNHFSKAQFNMLQQIASGLTIFIQNTLLFEEIKKSEEKYRTVVESAIDGVCVIGRDHLFKYVNGRLAEIQGFTMEELIGTDFRNLLDEESRTLLADREDKRARGIKLPPHFELNILHKDGKVRNAEISASAIKDSKGDVNIIVFLKDITDRKEAEEALRQSEEKTRQLSQENATVAEIGRIVSSTLNIEEVYERFAEEVRKIVPFDRVSVNTINPDRISITVAYAFGVKVEDIPAGTVLPLDDLLNESIVTKRSSFIIQARDENEVALHSPNFVRHFRVGLRSMMAVPLISKDEVIGILHIQSLKPHAYTESDVRMAEKVGNQIAGAIANAQLFAERKQAEEALRENENRLQALLDASPVGISWADMDGNIKYVNRKFVQLFGYTVNDIPNIAEWRRLAYLDPAYRDTIPSLIANLTEAQKQGKEVKPIEMTVTCKDGSTCYVEQMGTFVSNRILAIYSDLTERKRMEEALRESENKFRSLVENSIVGVYLIQEGIFKYANARLAEIHGYEVEEIVGKMGPKEAIFPEDLPIVERNINKRLKGEEKAIHYEFRIVTRSQEIRYVEVFGSHTMYQGMPAVLGTMLDITDRKKAEEALRQSEEKYRTILEDIQEGYFEVDLDGNFTFVNDAQCRNLGYPKEELVGMSNQQYTSQNSVKKMYDLFKKVYSTGKPAEGYNLEFIKKDGTKAFSEISVSLIRDSEGKQIGFRGISRDVTDRKRMEEQLFQAEKLRAVGEMASGVAHDFNNALAAILGNTQLLLYTAHDEELKETLKIIEKVAKDSGQTIRRLQDFTRKRVDQELFKVDVNSLIKDSMEITKPKWKDEPQSKGLHIEMVLNLEEIPPVSGNASELREVITNMIFNAIEAMPEGGKIEIHTFKKRRDVFIQISDSGIGIIEEAERKIFEPFFTTKPFTNTGLGLSMSYGIIKRFGGEIGVESKVGQGTTFTIILPIGGEEKEEAVSPQTIKKGREARILVIDDDEFVRSVLSRTLAQADHQVTLAENGEKGVQFFKEGKFDIVLTDLGMPGMSGWEVCRIIKEISPYTPVGMITGWGVEKNRNEVEECGLDFFISKPFDFNQILNMVSETMASKEE